MSVARGTPVTVNVERLVFDGLDLTPSQGAVVQRAFVHELTRLFQQPSRGGRWQGGAAPSVPATTVRVDGTVRPAQLGRDVARSVFSSLRNSP